MYQQKEKNGIRCGICPRRCLIKDRGYGFCGGRVNEGGQIRPASFPSGAALDPIEKKPLYHFHPGSMVLSAGTEGCNFKCQFCQNWGISQKKGQMPKNAITPSMMAKEALRLKEKGNIGIAYTYNEPSISYEYVLETAEKNRENGLKNILVTNGYMERMPQKKLFRFIDAANIDIKSIDDGFYRQYCMSSLAPTLRYAEEAKKMAHIEITNLVIPGLNSSHEQISRLSLWIAENLGSDTPLHLSAYFPKYRMTIGPTPPEMIEELRETALENLQYVYCGNIKSSKGSDTICPECGNTAVSRFGGMISDLTKQGRCPSCGYDTGIISGE